MRSEIILDSQYNDSVFGTPVNRVTSFVIKLPKFLLQELNTHKTINKNAASSRAIPVEKMKDMCSFTPVFWSKNERGMQGYEAIPEVAQKQAARIWEQARQTALFTSDLLSEHLGLHKQICNRLTEPFTMATVIATSDKWEQFFSTRVAPDVEPNFAYVSTMMLEQYLESTPQQLHVGGWHIPFIRPEEMDKFSIEDRLIRSAARCARVSYNDFYGKDDFESDKRLHDFLLESKHMSPFEHQVHVPVTRNTAPAGCYSAPFVTYRSRVDIWKPIDLKQRLLEMKALCQERGFTL